MTRIDLVDKILNGRPVPEEEWRDFLANLDMAIATLTPKDQCVLNKRLNGETYQEIGNFLNVTKSRIEQIQKKAIRKLRHPSRIKIYHMGMRSKEYKCYLIFKALQVSLTEVESDGVAGE